MTLSLSRLIIISLALTGICRAAAPDNIPLTDIHMAEPGIVIELRYATPNNFTGHALYPANQPALTRPEVVQRLIAAQKFLRRYDFRLKIWDAYRPKSIQEQLWQAAHNNDFVADPGTGAGSFHTWGVAVDVTLADQFKRSVSMPTDFDNFTPAASWKYVGEDPAVRAHLYLLQVAMRDAGFLGMQAEWWHFTIINWKQFLPPDEARRAEESFKATAQDPVKPKP